MQQHIADTEIGATNGILHNKNLKYMASSTRTGSEKRPEKWQKKKLSKGLKSKKKSAVEAGERGTFYLWKGR